MFRSISWRASRLKSLTLIGALQSWTATEALTSNCSFMEIGRSKGWSLGNDRIAPGAASLDGRHVEIRLDARIAACMPFHQQLAGVSRGRGRKAPPLLGSSIYYADSIMFSYCAFFKRGTKRHCRNAT